jgi:starch synthase (maltosyl-transferring)
MTPPLIYNLFPRLLGPTTRWVDSVRRALAMEFNWIYLNPWHYPGFSGSLYAPKELWRLNPHFLPPDADPHSLDPLRDFLAEARELGAPVMMDLVINHTAKDSPLIQEHPAWFVRDEHGEVVSPFVVDPDDPGKKTVWGDLAEVDNAHSPDRDALWSYWAELVRRSLELGFAGFRCDAAYKVPAELWRTLIDEARRVRPDVQFFAETLGAPREEVLALKQAGFDYFFNSSKWWNFREPWALEQHAQFGEIAPSIAFPESHDTARLAAETGGDERVQRQRYAFAAAFSAGVMMPIGYEYGFRRQVNVVETMPADWERRSFDLRDFVARVNRLKLRLPLLHGEGQLRAPWDLGSDVLLLERRSEAAGDRRGWILVNTVRDGEREVFPAELASDPSIARSHRLFRVCLDAAPEEGEPVPERLTLAPAEVAYVLPA